MLRTFSRKTFLSIAVLACLLQSCAGTQQLTRQDLESVDSITVARYRTPVLQVNTTAGSALMCLGGCCTAPAGAAIEIHETGKAHQGVVFPDYGKLLVQNFMRTAPKEISGWPKMKEANNPVERGYEQKGSAFLLFDIDHIWLTPYGGLVVEGDVVMKNQSGNKIAQQHFWYRSVDFGLHKTEDEFLADNRKLLIEEIPNAAEHTARDLIIRPLKQGL